MHSKVLWRRLILNGTMEFFGVFLHNEHIQYIFKLQIAIGVETVKSIHKNDCIILKNIYHFICTQHYNNCIREQQTYKNMNVEVNFFSFFRECFNVNLTSACLLGVSRGRTFRLTGGHRILDIPPRRHSRRRRHQRLCPLLDCPGMGF